MIRNLVLTLTAWNKPGKISRTVYSYLMLQTVILLILRTIFFLKSTFSPTKIMVNEQIQDSSVFLRATTGFISVVAIYFILDRGYMYLFRNRNNGYSIPYFMILLVKLLGSTYLASFYMMFFWGNDLTIYTSGSYSLLIIFSWLFFVLLEWYMVFGEFQIEKLAKDISPFEPMTSDVSNGYSIKTLIENGHFDEAIKKSLQVYKSDQSLSKEIAILNGSWHDLMKERNKISSEEFRREKRRLIDSLLTLISSEKT